MSHMNPRQGHRRTQEGFTLVELMVVVLVMAILLAIAIPTYLGARHRAEHRAAQSTLRTALLTADSIYAGQDAFEPPPNSGTTSLAKYLQQSEPNVKFVGAGGSVSGVNQVSEIHGTGLSGGNGPQSVAFAVYSPDGTCWRVLDIKTRASAAIAASGVPGPGTYYGESTGVSSCTASFSAPAGAWMSGSTANGTPSSAGTPGTGTGGGTVASSYDQYLLSLHPLAYYKFNQTSASQPALDSSGNGNNGTYVNNVTPGQPGPFAGSSSVNISSGPNSYPYPESQATANYISTPVKPANVHNYTIEWWVKPSLNSNTNGRVLASGWDDPVFNTFGGVEATIRPYVWTNSSAYNWPTPLPQGVWDFGALTVSVANGVQTDTLTVNGQAVTTYGTPDPYAWPRNLAIGIDPVYWGDNMIGSVSDVAVFNQVLTPAQIAHQYALATG